MARTDYEGSMAAGYDAGRGLTSEATATWTRAAAPFLAGADSHPILDLGAGTGRFSGLLHEWSGSPVVAAEPAAGMRQQLLAKRMPAVAGVVGAAGEVLPFRDEAFSGAWLSQVVHHFDDLSQVARELRRVVRPRGRVLVRGVFGRGGAEYGRTANAILYRYFPDALQHAKRFPLRDAVVKAFTETGVFVETTLSVQQVVAPNLRDYCARVRLRADSTLSAIDDQAFERGIRALEQAAREAPPDPIIEYVDLLVLQRPN